MAYTPKPNSFSIFKNNRKESDNHPDLTGTLNLGVSQEIIDALVAAQRDGRETVDLFCDAWTKEKQDGERYLSGRVKIKNTQGGRKDSGPAFQSKSNQGDLGYGRDTSPRTNARDVFADEKAKAQGDKVPGPRTFGDDIGDEIPF